MRYTQNILKHYTLRQLWRSILGEWPVYCLIVPLENFSLKWRRHHYRWRDANFELCSAFMAIEQWGFFSVPHLLLHGASVYNNHLRGPVTLTPIAERLTVDLLLHLPVFKTYVCRRWDSNTQYSACKANALAHCTTAAVIGIKFSVKRIRVLFRWLEKPIS